MPLEWEDFSGRGDPSQKYQLRRLCPCEACEGTGKEQAEVIDATRRCAVCRGEGRTLELVATCATPEAVGTALVQLALEGEFDDCPIGLLDTEGETGSKWLIRPWLASPRNASDAGKLLQRRRRLTK